jgi:mRNA-degrading endonuclease HigB of HigAB toxin-antitoxin module
MQVIALRTLREFWARHPNAEGPVRAWFAITAKARWANPAETKRQFGSTVTTESSSISAATNIAWSSTSHLLSAACS